jgi:hypothetical protein
MIFVKDSEKHNFYGSMQELLKDYPSLIDSKMNGKPYSNKLNNEFRKAGKYEVNGIEFYKGNVKRSPRK